MKKALAEIIAAFIPNKMARNQWRGKLRFGIVNMVKLKRQLKKDNSVPAIFLAVCAIAKNEGSYFKEWIEWHKAQGVEKFYIYDNGSTDNTVEVLRPYIEAGLVEYIYFPGYRRQLAAYDDCINRARYQTKWLAFIDLDEFIVPCNGIKLADYMKDFDGFSAVEFNWLIYGSGGAIKREPGTMMERFKKHSQPEHILNRHVKSVVDPKRVYCMVGCHEAARIDGYAADSHGNRLKKSFRQREPQQDVVRINHYAVRSQEEFREKQGRGRASGREKTVKDEYFARYDLNDLED